MCSKLSCSSCLHPWLVPDFLDSKDLRMIFIKPANYIQLRSSLCWIARVSASDRRANVCSTWQRRQVLSCSTTNREVARIADWENARNQWPWLRNRSFGGTSRYLLRIRPTFEGPEISIDGTRSQLRQSNYAKTLTAQICPGISSQSFQRSHGFS